MCTLLLCLIFPFDTTLQALNKFYEPATVEIFRLSSVPLCDSSLKLIPLRCFLRAANSEKLGLLEGCWTKYYILYRC
jgi:hypothetical protein